MTPVHVAALITLAELYVLGALVGMLLSARDLGRVEVLPPLEASAVQGLASARLKLLNPGAVAPCITASPEGD